jgi:hypothetical protein
MVENIGNTSGGDFRVLWQKSIRLVALPFKFSRTKTKSFIYTMPSVGYGPLCRGKWLNFQVKASVNFRLKF